MLVKEYLKLFSNTPYEFQFKWFKLTLILIRVTDVSLIN